MYLNKKILLLVTLLYVQTFSHHVPKLRSFSKELTYPDKRIILSSSPDVVTENESFLYAVCENRENTFKENRCNVTIETPAFENATYRDMCIVRIVANNQKLESLTKLTLQPFGDDKALITWVVKDLDWHTKSLQARVLHMSDCRYKDVSVLADKIHTAVIYDSSFDLVVRGLNKGLCGSDHCKFTFTAEGEKINGPSQFLAGVKLTQINALIPAAPRTPLKGFYGLVTAENGSNNAAVLQAGNDGKSSELLKTGHAGNVKLSNGNELFGVCWTAESTNVTCKQYDAKMMVKFTTVIQFLDDSRYGIKRWIRPHNLLGGGMILITGPTSGEDNRKFESFSIIKIQPNGHKERPLEIGYLDFECLSASEFRVDVSENDEDELCIHFICVRDHFDRSGLRNTLKFSTACLPKKHASMVKHQAAVLN